MECLELEVKACVLARKSYWTTLVWECLATHSMHALPRACSEAASPSSQATMASSLLSSSLSQVKSYSCSSSNIADVAATPEEDDLH
jgi:hypothetical protein